MIGFRKNVLNKLDSILCKVNYMTDKEERQQELNRARVRRYNEKMEDGGYVRFEMRVKPKWKEPLRNLRNLLEREDDSRKGQ